MAYDTQDKTMTKATGDEKSSKESLVLENFRRARAKKKNWIEQARALSGGKPAARDPASRLI